MTDKELTPTLAIRLKPPEKTPEENE